MNSTSDERQRSYWETERGFRSYDHPVVRSFACQRVDYVFSSVDLDDVQSLLDVGCGEGVSSFYFGRKVEDVHGLDRSSAMLTRNPLPAARLHVGDAADLPFEDESFDLVNAWEVLHHVENPQAVLSEMTRVTRKYVVVFEPNRYNPALAAFALWDREHRWILRHSLASLSRLATGTGMRVMVAQNVGWIFPNKTPGIVLGLLRHMPFRLPCVGISSVLICRKRGREEC